MVTNFKSSTVDDMKSRGESAAQKQVSLLRTPLKGLNFIASVAPLLGLLGTVIGMIICFDSLAEEAASASKSQAMAAGIRVALLTTAAGLTVAVPSLFAYFLFNQKLNLIVADCEDHATELGHELARIKRAAARAAKARSQTASRPARPAAEPGPRASADEAGEEGQ
jgi:biopolymer transport protein ExbB